MLSPSDYTLPLNEARGNDVQLQTDGGRKVISEYTEVINSSDAEKIIEYEIITVGGLDGRTFTNLENCLPNDICDDNQDFIPRCEVSIEEISPSNYHDQRLLDGTCHDSQDSISRCEVSIEEISPSNYHDQRLLDGTYHDSQVSISRCKVSIEEISSSNYHDQSLLDGTRHESQDSISRCEVSIEEISPSNYHDQRLLDSTYHDSQVSISRCEVSIKEISPSNYHDQRLLDSTYHDSQDSISRCEVSIEDISPLNYHEQRLLDSTFHDSQDSISRCEVSIEDISPSNYHEQRLLDSTFHNSQDSISRCEVSIEEISPSNYHEQRLLDSTFHDSQDSISRCEVSIEEISPSNYHEQRLLDSTFHNSQDSISRCEVSIEEISPSNYHEQRLLDSTFHDSQDSISRCEVSIEEISPSNYHEQRLLDGTCHDSRDSISRCEVSIEEISPSNYHDQRLLDSTYHDSQDSISTCEMSIEESSCNTNHVLNVENTSLDHLIECVVDDSYEENKLHKESEVSLDDAFRQCLNEISGDSSDEDNNFDNILKQLSTNGSSTETNHKRKILLSDEHIVTEPDKDNNSNCSCGYSKFENTNKKRIVDGMIDISRQSHSKSCREIHHNTFFDESEIEPFKKTYKRFLQQCICLNLPPAIDKCIECRVYQMKNNLTRRDYDKITCRFYAFRQLRFRKSGILAVAGYPDPFKNMTLIDYHMWLPRKYESAPCDFNIRASIKILEDAGGQFCMFVKEEIDALKLNLPYHGKPRKILWKKCVKGVREMCDVCRTTIFNHHWCCRKCGFVVCVDCFKTKLKDTRLTEKQTIVHSNFNKKIWLLCSNQKEHQVEKLFITQILAGNALKCISDLMHDTCHTHNIPLNCICNDKLEKIFPPNFIDPAFDKVFKMYEQPNSDDINCYEDDETLELKALINKQYEHYLKYCDNDSNKGIEEVKPEVKSRVFKIKSEVFKIKSEVFKIKSEVKSELFEIKSEDSDIIPKKNVEDTVYAVEHIKANEWFPPKLSLLSNDKTHTSHMWLCEGHLLRLLDPKSDINYTIFQEQWRRGQPVLVSDVGNKLDSSLWHPESFSRDFGNQINDLIDCTTGNVISDQPMSKFWNGFENAEERLCDKLGNVMLLKLKDWPPSADFAETLPNRFQDLMNCLPLKEYTHRNGKYNLASRLPDCYVRPDLGPKMYTAYGNAGTTHKQVGTTNLHLDISDAVNVMVYVAITKNCKDYDYDWHVREALQVIEEAGCDDLTLRRIYEHGETPGALWHIYHASDADSIRDLLIKVAVEHGTPLEQFSDPIHDQSHYLDEYLRERLFREYGVKGYAIVQYYGDAVFIPAGAPHQVRNLHNCIKVAEDFVSPENVHHSFRMTQEFRHLTDSHTNHEDKLQIKNIVFHAVKDSISVLMHTPHNLYTNV